MKSKHLQLKQWDLLCNEIKSKINYFENNKHDLSTTRGLYIYGEHGIGKTVLIKQLLDIMNYQIIEYDSCDYKIQNVVDCINNNNIGDTCVLSMFKSRKKKIILLDNLGNMINKEKSSITALVKILRAKKTKRQKKETISNIPIICINNTNIDKKVKELMNVCWTFYMDPPTENTLLEVLCESNVYNLNLNDMKQICSQSKHNFRNMQLLYDNHNTNMHKNMAINTDCFFNNTKDIVKNILNKPYSLSEHTYLLNDTDRTSVSMSYHENVIDYMNCLSTEKCIEIYSYMLDIICFADYIDRITFQKQVWTLNELSSIIKNIQNPMIFYDYLTNSQKQINTESRDIRFTKVLTKYSTEYNNHTFLMDLCQKLRMDSKDLISSFIDMAKNEDNIKYEEFHVYDITTLDIKRMLKFVKQLEINKD